MKASELKYGNKLLFLGEVVTFKNITEIREDGIFWIKTFEPGIEAKSFHFKPIPLTEEWLLRFGFVKDGGAGYKAPHNTQYWFFSLKNGFIPSVFSNRTIPDDGYLGCKHVHQVQNLYNALTNEDLEL